MKITGRTLRGSLLACCMLAGTSKLPRALDTSSSLRRTDENTWLRSLSDLNPVDAHVHVFKRDPALTAMLRELNLHLLDIAVVDDRDPFFKNLPLQLEKISQVMQESSRHVALCTTFSPEAP